MSNILKKTNTQARGRLKRQQLIDAARRLLVNLELNEITLADVANEAGASKGSAYHSYANIAELYMDVVGVIGQELLQAVSAPIEEKVCDWRDIIVLCLRRGTELLNNDPAARQLIHGPKSPPAIKRSDRANDLKVAEVIIGHLHKLPQTKTAELSAETLYYAIEIADVLYCLSVQNNGEITQQMSREGERAAIAYLELYLPSSTRA